MSKDHIRKLSIFSIDYLQFFAGEGASAGDGGGEGGGNAAVSTGASTVETGEQALLSLGVPAEKIRKTTAEKVGQYYNDVNRQRAAQNVANPAPAAAEQQPSNAPANAPASETEPKTNPNDERIAQLSREKAAANDKLKAIGDTLQLIAKEKGIEIDTSDMAKFDVDQFTSRLSYGEEYIENLAAELGINKEAAREMAELRMAKEQNTQREKKIQEQKLQEQKVQAALNHVNKLKQEAAGLKDKYPELNIESLLQDKAFSRLTSPSGGLSVEQAYWALNYASLSEKQRATAAQETEQKLTNAMNAGRRRPVENGSAPAVTAPQKDYRSMSRAEQLKFKADIQRRMDMGERVFL